VKAAKGNGDEDFAPIPQREKTKSGDNKGRDEGYTGKKQLRKGGRGSSHLALLKKKQNRLLIGDRRGGERKCVQGAGKLSASWGGALQGGEKPKRASFTSAAPQVTAVKGEGLKKDTLQKEGGGRRRRAASDLRKGKEKEGGQKMDGLD